MSDRDALLKSIAPHIAGKIVVDITVRDTPTSVQQLSHEWNGI
jgi:predicted dinucleotide-binding enzyme